MNTKSIVLSLVLSVMFTISNVYGEGFSAMEKQVALNTLLALKKLPYNQTLLKQQQRDIPLKSATRYIWAVREMEDEIDPQLYKDIFDRYDMHKYYDSEHFRIHYDTSGSNAVPLDDEILEAGVPDYVDSAALIFEYVWAYEIDSLGYGEILEYDGPVPDGGAGGNTKYDIYMIDIGPQGYYGATWDEGNDGERTGPSHIWVDNDYTDEIFVQLGYGDHPLDALKITAAHEFFHSLHYSLDRLELGSGNRAWWQEVTAVWMEDKVYDDVNDYLFYLKYFYRYPYISLMEFTLTGNNERVMHPYAAGVWAKYMDERYGEDIIKYIWSICADEIGENVLTAHETVFADSFNTTFDEAWQEFTVWNYYTDYRADSTVSFSEAHLWSDTLYPILYDTTFWIGGEEVSGTFSTSYNVPEPMGANYIYLDRRYNWDRGGVQFTFEGGTPTDARNEWRGQVLGWNTVNDRVEKIDISSATHSGEEIFRSWDSYIMLILIPTIYGFQYDDEGTGYSFSATYNSAFNDSAPIFYPLDTEGVVQAGDCLEFVISGYDPFGESLTFRSEPSADSIDELTLEALTDTSAMVTYCPGYELIDSVFSIYFYAEDPDSNYDITRLDIEITFFDTQEETDVSIAGYPNPYYVDNDERVNFKVLLGDSTSATDVRLYIFTVAGDLVNEIAPDEENWNEIGENTLYWDATNRYGSDIAAGIYLVKLRAGNNTADSKIAVIR